jgi:hypothetical protein
MNLEIPRPTQNHPYFEKQERENIYVTIVMNKLWDQFKDQMSECDFSDQEIAEIEKGIPNDPERAKSFFAVPFELQQTVFSKYKEKVTRGEIKPADIPKDLIQKMNDYGFTIGFHLSNKDIHPNDGNKWEIIGKQEDHRDSDRSMAYYSHSFAKRYTAGKELPILYVIRSETGKETAHKQDNDNSWGRASKLSVIAKLDMTEIDKTVEHIEKEAREEKKKGGQ